MLLNAFFNMLGVVLRLSEPEIGDYDKLDSYQLLFVCIFSWIFALFSLLQVIMLNPSRLLQDQDKSIIIDDQKIAEENQEEYSNPIGRIENEFPERTAFQKELF